MPRRTKIVMNGAGLFAVLCVSAAATGLQKKTPFVLKAPKPLTAAQIKTIFPATSVTVFDKPDNFTLYTIHPMRVGLMIPPPHTASWLGDIDGYRITGKTTIKNRAEQAHLLASAFAVGPEVSLRFNCFSPHHALRTTKGNRMVDMIICFGCGNTQIWENHKPRPLETFANRGAAGYVDSVLAAHHVAPPKYSE